MPLYQYVCPSGHTTERIRGLEESTAPCLCGQEARRSEVNHFAISTPEPYKEERGGVRDFVEASQEVDYHYTKAENNGVPVKRPNLYQRGLSRAKKMGAKVNAAI